MGLKSGLLKARQYKLIFYLRIDKEVNFKLLLIISTESLFNLLSFFKNVNLFIYINVREDNFIDISLYQHMTKQRHTVLFIQVSHHDYC